MTKSQKERLIQLRYEHYMGVCQFWNDDTYEEYLHLENLAEDERMKKYTINYKGYIFDGDADGWNSRECDEFAYAMSIYDNYADEDNKMYITDNEYGVTFANDTWI